MRTCSGTVRPEKGLIIASRYELVDELGRGGMGSVWLANDGARGGSKVALKFQDIARLDAAADRRFAREAEALCRLSCPNVVRFLDAGHEHGLRYIVMQHLMGHTLRRRLQRNVRLTLEEAIDVVRQAANGLTSAHRAGVVHLDVKPSNLFMSVEHGAECLKLIDFGLARSQSLTLSTTGSGTMGSPAYMSPELARGEQVDPRADVWSLAVVAFTMLSGSEPFTEPSVPATMQRIYRSDARRITQLLPTLPVALDRFFARAFVQDRGLRFQDSQELARHFEEACRGVAVEAKGRLDKTKSIPPDIPQRIRAVSYALSQTRARPRPLSAPRAVAQVRERAKRSGRRSTGPEMAWLGLVAAVLVGAVLSILALSVLSARGCGGERPASQGGS